MRIVFLVALLAWAPDGAGTKDSGFFGDPTLSECHARSRAFTEKHGTPIQLCVGITDVAYRIISSTEVVFDFEPGNNGTPHPDEGGGEGEVEVEVKRLIKALKDIGRLHRGKTRDSQKVRKIIREATK